MDLLRSVRSQAEVGLEHRRDCVRFGAARLAFQFLSDFERGSGSS